MPRRQPRKPSIGLNSCSSSTRLLHLARRRRQSSSPASAALRVCRAAAGTRAAADRAGGSCRAAVQRAEDAFEIVALMRQQLGERLCGRRAFSARIICRMAMMRSPSKNMCSVRHRPMPSAPNAMAFSACSGVIGVGSDAKRVVLVGPLHECAKLLILDRFASPLQSLPMSTCVDLASARSMLPVQMTSPGVPSRLIHRLP